MKWLTWDQALVVVALAVGLMWAMRQSWFPRSRMPTWLRWLEPFLMELAIIWGLYAVWRIARQQPFTQESGAIDRGYAIYNFGEWIGWPSELAMQRMVAPHDWLVAPMSYYYSMVHVPALFVFLIWMFARRRDDFPHWRSGLAWVTAGCLLIRFVRVAPPRFYPDLGFVDLTNRFGPQVYGELDSGVSDQFAAMPSIHVAWAAVISFGLFAVTSGRWRWMTLSHLVITFFVVAATGHHWHLDGIVAIVLLWMGLAIDNRYRRYLEDRSVGGRVEALAEGEPVGA